LDYPEPLYIILGIFNPLSVDVISAMLVMAVLLLCSALISGSEVALFSFSKKELDDFKKSENLSERKIFELISEPKQLLATILIGNNFINISIVLISTLVINKWLKTDELSTNILLIIQLVVVSFLILLFGEILPKVYASVNGIKVARLMAFPLSFLNKVFYLPNKLLLSSTSFIDKRITKKGIDFSANDLEHVLELTQDEDTTADEKKMLEGIVKFGNTDVKQIMVPRLDMFAH
jgi:putative hemolysin